MAAAHEHAGGHVTFSHRGVEAQQSAPQHCTHAIVVARFNGAITKPLFVGAVDVLLDAGVPPAQIAAVSVPGCIEVPLATQWLASQGSMELVVALGCVIRGETSHFDHVCSIVSDGCLRVTLDTGVPVGFGVLTCDTAAQAEDRAGVGVGERNAGADAARAALDMRALLQPPGEGSLGFG